MKKIKCIESNQIFRSAAEASKIFNLDRANITKCCNGKLKSCGGYHFEYVNQAPQQEPIPAEPEQVKPDEPAPQKADTDVLDSDINDTDDLQEQLRKKLQECFAEGGWTDADDYTSIKSPAPKPKPQPPEQPGKTVDLPNFDWDTYRHQVEQSSDINELKRIQRYCNDVLTECKKWREANEFMNTTDLRLLEFKIRDVRQFAQTKIDNIKNPQIEEPPKPVKFRWGAADEFVNEMWLKEISFYDEMMCQIAKENHEQNLQRYKQALDAGTMSESEYTVRTSFEHEYLAKLNGHYQELVNKRIEFNEKYEAEKFGFDKFAILQKHLEKTLINASRVVLTDEKIYKMQNAINSHEKQMEKDLQELNDSITPDGIIYNKYSVAMRYQILAIAKGKLKAYEHNEEYMCVSDDAEAKAVASLNNSLNKIKDYSAEKLETMKTKIFAKIQEKNATEYPVFVASLCAAFRQINDELEIKF